MAKSSWSHALVWVSLAGALAGCSTVPDSQRSAGPPIKVPEVPIRGDELVPQVEPPSRTGNSDTYVVFGRRYRVRETSEGYRERGIASWYGWDFHGRKTSSGPPFNMFDLTAAHKSLPLPTYVRVTNLDNGRNTIVKITDRGPFVGTRLIDLSYAAADRLGMLEQGTAPVEVVALAPYQTLSDLAARRTEQRELLASRAQRVKLKVEATEIEFAYATPIRPLTPTPVQPPVVLADSERSLPPVKAPVRLVQADVELATPKVVARPLVRLVQADVELATPKVVARPLVRLAQADVELATPKVVARPLVRLAQADVVRNKPQAVVKPPVRLALADMGRATPRAVMKAANVKPAKTEDDRNSGQPSVRPSSVAPVAKGREAGVKPAVPASNSNSNRNGKPVTPRQASESRPAMVRLASLKLNRSRGFVD